MQKEEKIIHSQHVLLTLHESVYLYGKKKAQALLKVLLNIIYQLIIANCFKTGVHLRKANSAHYIVPQKLYVIYSYEYR